MEAVKSELISDVPLGAFLSGGIDSPLTCYYAQQCMDKPLKAVTIGSDSAYDESGLAKQYGDFIGLNHTIKQMNSSDALSTIDDVMASLTEPFADFSIIPTYQVSKLARKQVTVALSGDGGDELFFGYERFWSVAKNRKVQHLPYRLKYLMYGMDKLCCNNSHINSAALFTNQGRAHMGLHSRFAEQILNELAPDLQNMTYPSGYDVYNYPATSNESELLQYMRHAEFYGMMQKTLRKVDRASMANSLEVRVPFLKKSFIEASLKIDPFLSYGPNQGKNSNKKVLLKNLLKRNLQGSPIDDIKRGFAIPLADWLRHDLKDTFENLLLDRGLNQYFGFDSRATSEMLQKHSNRENDNKWPLFTLYSLFKWKQSVS